MANAANEAAGAMPAPGGEADARRGGAKRHRWKFYRAGGVDQVALRDGRDLVHLRELDRKLWVALALPTRGVHIDPKTLAVLDLDGDGRIRLPEILATIDWLEATLKDLDPLFRRGDAVPLAALRDGPVLKSARRILVNLGKADADAITLGDVGDTARIFAETRFNGDGIVPADAAEDPATRQAIEDIIAVLGSAPDRSGKPGIDRPRLEAFAAGVRAIAEWQARRTGAADVLGPDTAAAAAALAAVRAKIDDYFARCRLAAYDPRAAALVGSSDAELAALAAIDQSGAPEGVRRLPQAQIEAGRALPLGDGINPGWAAEVAAFVARCVRPLAGDERQLTAAAWQALKERFAAYEAWWAGKPATPLEPLGFDRLAALAASDFEARIGGLLLQDCALEEESAQIASVERLLLLQRDLVDVLHNFVNFADFYARKGAVFQAGTLVLDGRSCHLCLEVADVAKHAALAPMAGAFLAYCDCTRAGGAKLTIAAAFTDGDEDHLMIGRNGVFFDRQGRDWDATITKIVSNPISIRAAFWSPYKKLARLIEQQVGKRAASADAASSARLGSTAQDVVHADKATAAPGLDPKKDDRAKIDVGTVAAIGVAVGGIGAMVTGILSAFFGLGIWMPLGIMAVLLAISGPSMLLAYLKLRQRNLGPLLDANGWAINGRARINVPFGGALTDVARLPRNAERSLKDPYAEKRSPWGLYVVLLLLVVLAATWYVGKLDRFLPEAARSSSVLQR
jgi:hypothetical protein